MLEVALGFCQTTSIQSNQNPIILLKHLDLKTALDSLVDQEYCH